MCAAAPPVNRYLGDEITPVPHTRSPSRGIELCGVVEAMYSYEAMYSVHGTLAFADRAERIAYNALPATWASPTGGDMWAHQYLQAVNEINAIKSSPHVWQHDNAFSETYGLEPNFGCCTANFHQGWPKFANSLFHFAPDGGVVVSMWAPAAAKLPSGATVEVDTTYPFGDDATVTVRAVAGTPVYLRIPGWAVKATVNGAAAANGTLFRGVATGGADVFAVAFRSETRRDPQRSAQIRRDPPRSAVEAPQSRSAGVFTCADRAGDCPRSHEIVGRRRGLSGGTAARRAFTAARCSTRCRSRQTTPSVREHRSRAPLFRPLARHCCCILRSCSRIHWTP